MDNAIKTTHAPRSRQPRRSRDDGPLRCQFGNPLHILCNNAQCYPCYIRSFASRRKSRDWSSRNAENPRQVFKYANKKYLFDCRVCGNTYELPLDWDSRRNSQKCSHASHASHASTQSGSFVSHDNGVTKDQVTSTIASHATHAKNPQCSKPNSYNIDDL